MELAFLLLFFLVVYAYLGYGLVVYALVRLRRALGWNRPLAERPDFEPEVTLVVPAYNESAYLPGKLDNSLALDYPADKLKFLFVTEGSTDGSTQFIERRRAELGARLGLIGGRERLGKVAAMNGAMRHVTTPFVVFTDANTRLNREAIRHLVRPFADDRVAAVAGEKRIATASSEAAAGAGEGLYWRYESGLKKLDAELHTVVGAAGELFAVRTALYQPVEPDTLLDDFVISLRLAGRGYRVAYAPDAYALERPSYSVAEEQKRKVRIAHGGFQAMSRLLGLLNPFRHGWLTFQYVSHRALRWAVTPFCLPLLLVLNVALAWEALQEPSLSLAGVAWLLVLAGQVAFYAAAWMGYRLEQRHLRRKIYFVPFYFTFMNVCVLLGFGRFLRNNPTGGQWERVRRADEPVAESVRAVVRSEG
jgi:cellulose synthase/poly-beta-1,6-N-acetylglucosamine synthase-like glycosyltransferase